MKTESNLLELLNLKFEMIENFFSKIEFRDKELEKKY